MSQTRPRPAAFEECDDNGVTMPGTRVEARTGRVPVIDQPFPPVRVSSRTRNSTTSPPLMTAIGPGTSSQGLPLLQRSSSINGRRSSCHVNCTCLRCSSARNPERRFVRPMAQPLQTTYAQQTPLQSQPILPNTRADIPAAVPRVRSSSNAARPQSWAGIPPYQIPQPPAVSRPAITTSRGPPPSPSAYQALAQSPLYPGYTYDPFASQFYPSTTYIPPAPATMYTAPLTHNYTSTPQPVRTVANDPFSARVLDLQPQSPRHNRRSSSSSRRLDTNPRLPGSYPEDDYDDYYYEQEAPRSYSPVQRDRDLMPPPPRRTNSTTSRTSARVDMSSRDRYDTDVYDSNRTVRPSSSRRRGVSEYGSDDFESSHTIRPSDTRRHSTTSSRSRQQSVSTAGSSQRTPATTISTESRGGFVVITENGHRRSQYLRAGDYARLKRYQAQQMNQEQDRTAQAEAYQDARRGEVDELTAENIRQMLQQEDVPRAPGSRTSHRSRRSLGSATLSEGFKITFGESTVHFTGRNANVDVRDSANGPQITINSSNGRSGSYYTETSRSSGSRVGRSRGGSDRRSPPAIIEA